MPATMRSGGTPRNKSEYSTPEDGIGNADMQAIAARARAADGPEREAYRKAGTAIGYGIGSLFALIDPAPVAFVGGGAAAFDLLEPHIRAAIAETAGGQHSDAISFDTVPRRTAAHPPGLLDAGADLRRP